MRYSNNSYVTCADDPSVTILTVASGHEFLIDTADRALVGSRQWHVVRDAKAKYIYAGSNDGDKVLRLHRFLMGVTDPKVLVDHENRNTLDTRRKNLRIADRSKNMCNSNKRCDNTSGYIGVYFEKDSQRFAAQVSHNKKMRRLGRFTDAITAAIARDRFVIAHYGEFYELNFPHLREEAAA